MCSKYPLDVNVSVYACIHEMSTSMSSPRSMIGVMCGDYLNHGADL